MTARWWLGGAGALAVAFWGGTQMAGPTAQRTGDTGAATPVTGGPVVPHAAPPTPPPRGLTRDDVRALLREELARKASSSEPTGPAAPRAVLDAAHAAVSDAIARGRWSSSDRAALRAQLVHLDATETHEVLSPLFQAINAQQLELDGPPI